MKLIVKKIDSNLFLFCESSDGLSYDGKIIGGNDVKLSFCDDIAVVQVVDGERFNFKKQQLNYDNGIEIIGFASMLEFIEAIKADGFTGNFNSGGGGSSITGFSTETTLSAINTKVPNKGQANSANSTPVVIANDQSPIPTTPRANTSGTGGTTPYKLIATASVNANVVKASAGNLYSIIAIGVTSTVRYLKLYNKATMPTLNIDVPIMTIPIPANTQGAGVCLPFSMGVNFSNGISIAITANPADNDTTPIGAGDVIVNLTHA